MMKLSLVLLTGLAAAACLRTRSAALRHWVLATAIVCAAATPFVERAAPHWTFDVALPTAATTSAPPVSVDVSIAENSQRPAAAGPVVEGGAFEWLVVIWIVGAALSLGLLAAGLGRLAWLTSRGRPAPVRWEALADEIQREQPFRRKVALIQSDHPSLLATWGLFRPRIIFPARAAEWPDDLVRVILRHEMSHIRRGDWLLQMAGEVFRAVYWFNPLAWLACRRLRIESEQACDDDVLRGGTEAPDYAAHLVTLARHFSEHRTWFPAPAMARRSTLHRRVAAMLNTRIDRRPVGAGVRVATLALLLVVTMTVAAAQSSRTFSGTIVDPQGGVLPGVAVTLTNADGRAAETTTNRSGQFQFAGLPGGNYTVRVQIPGFRSYEAQVTVASANVVQTIGLEIGQVQEMISVVDPGKDAGTSEPMVSSASAVPDRGCGAQSAPASGAVRIGGSIRVPLKLKDVKPVFPASLRGTGASADVVLDAIIGTDGFVHDIRARDVSQPAFVDAFVQAVTQWQFAATLLNCVAIETPITITGHFRSNGGV